jgi:hypothetical protein
MVRKVKGAWEPADLGVLPSTLLEIPHLPSFILILN